MHRHRYLPTHRLRRSNRHVLTRLAVVTALASSALAAPFSTGGAQASTPSLPVCGSSGGCVTILESLVPGGTDALIAGVETQALQLEQSVTGCLNGSSPTCTMASTAP